MIKKIYRRFLMVAIMLLMATSLTYIVPSVQAQDDPPRCYLCYCDSIGCECVPVACP